MWAILAAIIICIAGVEILTVCVCLKSEIHIQNGSKTVAKPIIKADTKNVLKTDRRYYHGTTREAALEIFYSGLWMIGESNPRGIYVAENISIAKEYSQKDGAIIEIIIDDVPLQKRYEGAFFFEIPGATPFQEYYKIDGLKIVGVLDADGNKIL